MKRAATAVLAALVLAACGSDDDGDTPEETTAETVAPGPDSAPGSDTALFRADDVGFTFRYPKEFVRERPRGVLGQVSSRRGAFFNAIKVREAADRELPPENYLEDFRRDFERRVGRVDRREETIGELDVGVLEFRDSHRAKGETVRFTSTSYFFSGAGRTWQIECVAEPEAAAEIDAACREALESVDFAHAR